MIAQTSFTLRTHGRGTYEVTDRVQTVVGALGLETGLVHVFVHHTSASLILCENADPTVRRDLETFMAATVPDGSPLFEHVAEGLDDMPAHVRSILTQSDLTIPLTAGRCALGTWQGIYLWEHRHAGHARRLTVTVMGDKGTIL
jgi:secondary thiamine-phosphate synthase enzyme